jgi:hypothetical protein
MVLFLATPIPEEYQKPITLLIAGLAFLGHGVWCRYLADTDENPDDSCWGVPLPSKFSRDEWFIDIGFQNKFLICMVVGGILIAGAALAFPFKQSNRGTFNSGTEPRGIDPASER